jgi:hypothetical protein
VRFHPAAEELLCDIFLLQTQLLVNLDTSRGHSLAFIFGNTLRSIPVQWLMACPLRS